MPMPIALSAFGDHRRKPEGLWVSCRPARKLPDRDRPLAGATANRHRKGADFSVRLPHGRDERRVLWIETLPSSAGIRLVVLGINKPVCVAPELPLQESRVSFKLFGQDQEDPDLRIEHRRVGPLRSIAFTIFFISRSDPLIWDATIDP
jgi:hypothetical protein